MADDIRCPTCQRVDWSRDGFMMVAGDDGVVMRQRVALSRVGPASWSCGGCPYVAPDDSELGARLTEARILHED